MVTARDRNLTEAKLKRPREDVATPRDPFHNFRRLHGNADN